MKRMALILLMILLWTQAALAQAYRPLSAGNTGTDVVTLQQRLIELGLLDDKADGIYGDKTAAAVAEAQRLLAAEGFAVEQTGEADADTLAALYDPNSEMALRTLRSGSRGDAVTELQNRLVDLKLLDGDVDGIYGSQTEEAVRAFQEEMIRLGETSLDRDGVATPQVTSLLFSDLSSYGYVAPPFFDESQPLSLTPDYLYSQSCLVLDVVSGEVLFEYRCDERMFPASTTKIMTLLLALEHGGLEETVTIPSCAADVPKDSSLVPVTPGERMRMIDLLYGLMIRSGNDAANAVAELCAGSVNAFVDEMNARAAELGMTGTHFVNAHGYHSDEHYTTARDLATLTRYALTNQTFCQIVSCLSYTLPATSKRDALTVQNTYEIFDPASPSYIQGAAGVKSGYTSHAGFCYVGAYQSDGRTLVAVLLNAPGRQRGFSDLKRLFAYAMAQ